MAQTEGEGGRSQETGELKINRFPSSNNSPMLWLPKQKYKVKGSFVFQLLQIKSLNPYLKLLKKKIFLYPPQKYL